jgi:hypothetical protein
VMRCASINRPTEMMITAVCVCVCVDIRDRGIESDSGKHPT